MINGSGWVDVVVDDVVEVVVDVDVDVPGASVLSTAGIVVVVVDGAVAIEDATTGVVATAGDALESDAHDRIS